MSELPKPLIGLFENDIQENIVNRILDRAVQKRVDATKTTRRDLAKVLARTLIEHSARETQPDRPSIRQSAPGPNGGRSFHFEHTVISKRPIPPKGQKTLKDDAPAKKASAHQSYIERSDAVERTNLSQAEVADKGADKSGLAGAASETQQDGSVNEASSVLSPRHRQSGGHASAGQDYIENLEKLKVESASFGNIGATLEERKAFWDILGANERVNARLQNRLICELPHQSTPAARREIMERLIQPLQEAGLCYHVAIHAPTEKNDSRNFHAHVVYADRRAKKMLDPVSGSWVWDFSIIEKHKKKNRVVKIRHPYRQGKVRELQDRDYVYRLRERYAEIVNAVMEPIDPSVKFDARSYEKMGVDLKPIRTIKRAIFEMMRDGGIILHDVGWTKRRVAAQITSAARRGDPEMTRLVSSIKALNDLRAAWPSVNKINRLLHVNSQMLSLGTFTRQTFSKNINERIGLVSLLSRERIVGRTSLETCNRLIDATNPVIGKGMYGVEVRSADAQADLSDLSTLAKGQLARVRAGLKEAERRAKTKLKANRDAFRSASTMLLPSFINGLEANVSAMYDKTLTGAEFADSLKSTLDEIFPERGGVHPPCDVLDWLKERPGVDEAGLLMSTGRDHDRADNESSKEENVDAALATAGQSVVMDQAKDRAVPQSREQTQTNGLSFDLSNADALASAQLNEAASAHASFATQAKPTLAIPVSSTLSTLPPQPSGRPDLPREANPVAQPFVDAPQPRPSLKRSTSRSAGQTTASPLPVGPAKPSVPAWEKKSAVDIAQKTDDVRSGIRRLAENETIDYSTARARLTESQPAKKKASLLPTVEPVARKVSEQPSLNAPSPLEIQKIRRSQFGRVIEEGGFSEQRGTPKGKHAPGLPKAEDQAAQHVRESSPKTRKQSEPLYRSVPVPHSVSTKQHQSDAAWNADLETRSTITVDADSAEKTKQKAKQRRKVILSRKGRDGRS